MCDVQWFFNGCTIREQEEKEGERRRKEEEKEENLRFQDL
jgi:hypothetical protein